MLPRVFRQQRRAGDEIGERRGISSRRLRPPSREQVELGQLLALIPYGDLRGAAVELIDDLEQMLGEPVRRRARQQRAAYAQVDAGTVLFGNE